MSDDEAVEQVCWSITCGLVDIVEISGGNGEGTGECSAESQALRARANVWFCVHALYQNLLLSKAS